MKNTPDSAPQTGSENRVARNSVSCFGSSRRRESRPLLGRSGDNLTLLQERVVRSMPSLARSEIIRWAWGFSPLPRCTASVARAGIRERITGASLEQQYRDALENGDEREAARLEYREPGVHIGPHNVARSERGVALERTATAQGGGGSATRRLRATAKRSKRWRGSL